MMLLLQDERVLSGTVSEASPTVGSSQARARAADVTAPPCGGGGGAGPGPGGCACNDKGLDQWQGPRPPPAGPGRKEPLPGLSIILRRKGGGKKNWPGKWTELATWFNNQIPVLWARAPSRCLLQGNPGQAWGWEQESLTPQCPQGPESQKRGPRSLEPAVAPPWPGRENSGVHPQP